MEKVLIIGATSAWAQSVIECLNKTSKYHVVGTCRNCINDTSIQLDVCDLNRIKDIILDIKPDIIINLAVSYSNEFDEAYAVNVHASRFILDLDLKLRLKMRIILIGSAAEYGFVKVEDNPINENHILNPVSIYGLSKAWQTQLATYYAGQGVNVLVARVFNLDGEILNDNLLIGRLNSEIKKIQNGKSQCVKLGPLSATRDYLTINEASIQLLAILKYGLVGHVYHIASGKPMLIRNLVMNKLKELVIENVIIDESIRNTNRAGYDIPVIYADTNKIMNLMKSY